MNNITDLLQLVLRCVTQFRDVAGGKFALTLVIAAMLSALCWFVCAKWTYLWNKRFHARRLHHVFCGMAASLTFAAVIIFASLPLLKPVADMAVTRWSAILAAAETGRTGAGIILPAQDRERAARWNLETFLTARHEVFLANKAGKGPAPYSAAAWRGAEPENNYSLNSTFNGAALRQLAAARGWTLDPDELHESELPGVTIPGEGVLDEISAGIFANHAIDLFKDLYPYLSRLFWSPSDTVSRDLILKDFAQFNAANPKVAYPLARATRIAREEVRKKLEEQTPRVVTIGRWILAGLFVCAQAVPFGLIGWAAYRDLRESRSSGPIPGTVSRGAVGTRGRIIPRGR